MRVIAGLVASPNGSVAASAFGHMSRHAPASIGKPEADSASLFTSLGSETIEGTADTWSVADLALTNLPELHALTGVPVGHPGIVAALYALEGASFVRRLRGGFALAVWDRRRRTLLLAVDHFGIKRLYHTHRDGTFAFASRVHMLRHGGATVDPASVYAYLNFGFVPAPASILLGVHRLPPGHCLEVRDGAARLECYWDLAYTERPIDETSAVIELSRLATDAVTRTLGEAVPKEVGAFLSGGTDSSVVLGLASRLTGERVSAFSIGFREERYNELGYAEIAARHFGAAHHTKLVGPDDALDAVTELVDAYDEPFGNNSAIGTLLCARLARECGVTRMLAGDGGDEIFGGNERYRVDRVFSRYHDIPAAVRRGLLEPIVLTLPDGGVSLLGRAQRYIRRANLPNPRRAYSWEFFFAQEPGGLLAPDFCKAIDLDAPWDHVERLWTRVGTASELNRQMYLDLKLAIGDNDLLKVGRTAEMAGVEVRFPLLDLPLVQWTTTLPDRYKLRRLEKRYLFKRAFRSLVPAEVLAKRKHGFGVPTSLWLKASRPFRDHVRDVLLSSRLRQRGYLASGATERLLALHDANDSPYYGDILWRLFMLELWHRHHVDGVGP